MPLRDALNLSAGKTGSPPITEDLVNNIAEILSSSKPEPNTYDVGAVFTAMVYAIRMLESEVAQHKKAHDHLSQYVTALHKRIVALETR